MDINKEILLVIEIRIVTALADLSPAGLKPRRVYLAAAGILVCYYI